MNKYINEDDDRGYLDITSHSNIIFVLTDKIDEMELDDVINIVIWERHYSNLDKERDSLGGIWVSEYNDVLKAIHTSKFSKEIQLWLKLN